MSYANRHRAPRTLTEGECKRLLKLSGKRAEDFRDHVLFAIALGTGLRISEIAALDCGDVYNSDGGARTRIMLRVFKGSTKKGPKGKQLPQPTPQEVMIGDQLRAKLDRFRKWKAARAQWLGPDDPLFSVSMGRPRRLSKPTATDYLRADAATKNGYPIPGVRRMTKRRISERWDHWRKLAKLPAALGFHCLRHTFCQRLYEHTRDVRLVQRAARHVNLTTTTIYASASADDVLKAVQGVEL